LAATVYADEGQKSYEGWVLIKAQPTTEEQVAYLMTLFNDKESGFEVQVWQQGTLKRPFDIFISPQAKESFFAKLDELGIHHETRSNNVQRAIDNEKIPVPSRTRTLAGVRNANLFNRFLRLDEINAAVDTLVAANKEMMTTEIIGYGWEKRPIRLVKISTNNNNKKPGIWIDGGIHAREWASPATVLYMLHKLVNGYRTNYTQLVDSATWYFVVVLNPDGYDYTHTRDRMWRKNRRPGPRGCEGVDLNRNFGYDFGGLGTSDYSCDDTYRGPSAFSEPESQAVQKYLATHKDINTFLTIHAYSQMWFIPFGNALNNYPRDYAELKSIADAGARALSKKYRTQYDVGTAADLLYEAAGGSDDWAKGVAGIKYVFCLELQPSGNAPGNGFILHPSKIVASGEETFDGMLVVAMAAIKK